ncbi:putative beta-carotene-binding protein [Hylaeus volcanicus]|uniref:putative beta-carotene-binding protein n=1 Tax=Hylaeus volcanicus TaxID=313075 RepID=UPI0023B87691|nr:putative beta-carotene-binding protein [Hylaeus volcanicus]
MFSKELLFLAIVVGFATAKVPDYIHVCGAKNPHLDECIIKSVEALAPKLRNGIPEFDIPPTDPLIIGTVKLTDIPNIQATGSDVKLHGLDVYHIDFLHMDLEKQTLDVVLRYDKIQMDASYSVTAKILVPISGEGPINLSADNVLVKVHMKYSIIERNGKKYMYFSSMKTQLDVKDFTAKFEASNVDKTLQEAITQALGSSHQEILEATKPNLERFISQMCLDSANKICKHFTFDELFPDRE